MKFRGLRLHNWILVYHLQSDHLPPTHLMLSRSCLSVLCMSVTYPVVLWLDGFPILSPHPLPDIQQTNLCFPRLSSNVISLWKFSWLSSDSFLWSHSVSNSPWLGIYVFLKYSPNCISSSVTSRQCTALRAGNYYSQNPRVLVRPCLVPQAGETRGKSYFRLSAPNWGTFFHGFSKVLYGEGISQGLSELEFILPLPRLIFIK